MGKLYGGIDPGKQGVIFCIQDGEKDYRFLPVVGKEYDHQGVKSIFKELSDNCDDMHFVLEGIHATNTWGATTNFSLGGCMGMLKQVLTDLDIPFTVVPPKTWQKEMWQGISPKHKPLSAAQKKQGRKKGSIDTKSTSELAAKRLFPTFEFNVTNSGNKSKNFNDNIGDAALMAEYCRRKFN